MVSALYFQKFNGDKQMLEQLNSGVGKRVWDPNGSINGKTALRWACVYRDVKLIKHLIEVMECTVTNVSVDDGDGWSPLIEAAAQGWTEGVDILLKKKQLFIFSAFPGSSILIGVFEFFFNILQTIFTNKKPTFIDSASF